eukprot:COSAG06_NODE_55207_length_290_cov_1.633508_1_plen_73_part_10
MLLIKFYTQSEDPASAAAYAEAASKLAAEGHHAVLARLDTSAPKAELIGINEYPAVLLFKSGENIEPYSGEMS